MEKLGLEEDLTVRDGDNVGRDISGYVARLCLNDRKRRNGSAAELGSDASSTLEKSGMQIKYVTGVSLTSRRPSDKKRESSVSNSMLREIIVNDEYVFSLLAEILSHSAARIRCDVLDRCTLGSSSGYDYRIRQSTFAKKLRCKRNNGRSLLSDSNIDAYYILVLLVNDCIG